MVVVGINRNNRNELFTEKTSLLPISSSSSSLNDCHRHPEDFGRGDANSPRRWRTIIIIAAISIVGIIGGIVVICSTAVGPHTLPTGAAPTPTPPPLQIRNELTYDENTDSMISVSTSNVRQDIVEHNQPEKVHFIMPTPMMYLSEKQQQQRQTTDDDKGNISLSLRWGILGLGMRVSRMFLR